MKKNLRKSFSAVLSLVLVFALSLVAFAAGISAEDAKSIAVSDAGFRQSDVLYLRVEKDFDDGIEYFDVSFAVKESENVYVEYDYDILVSNGNILSKDVERERVPGSDVPSVAPQVSNGADIGESAAKKAALAHFGVNEQDAKFIKASKEYDDGVQVYDIEFCVPYEVKYSCDVVASNGAVVDSDKDVARNIFDKLELIFEVLFAQLFDR